MYIPQDIQNGVDAVKMQIGRWGNSLAVRLPKDVVTRFNLREGDEIDSSAIERALEATEKAATDDRRQKALEWIASRRYTLPPDYKFDRDEANAR